MSAVDVVTEDGLALGHWCSEQRKAYRLGRLAPRKKRLLEALGFILSPFDAAWEKRYQALVAFKEEHGHLRVAQRQVGGFRRARVVALSPVLQRHLQRHFD